jgi:hypothetical protein
VHVVAGVAVPGVHVVQVIAVHDSRVTAVHVVDVHVTGMNPVIARRLVAAVHGHPGLGPGRGWLRQIVVGGSTHRSHRTPPVEETLDRDASR